MNKISTQLDIIRYIYKELEEKESLQIKVQSHNDPKTKNLLDFYADIKCELDDIKLTPSKRVIENIKKISSSLKVTSKDCV